MSEQVQQGHLGGYIKGGDEATYYPDLWKWLVNMLPIFSVIDVGCGEGQALDYFLSIPISFATGVDGCYTGHPTTIIHDYTDGPFIPKYEYDLCWCCEFVEHVEEKYIPNFLETFKKTQFVLMTHAFPGQDGYHHVNCRVPEYWIGVMAAIGFVLDITLTTMSRQKALLNPSPWNHFVRSGLAFRRQAAHRLA